MFFVEYIGIVSLKLFYCLNCLLAGLQLHTLYKKDENGEEKISQDPSDWRFCYGENLFVTSEGVEDKVWDNLKSYTNFVFQDPKHFWFPLLTESLKNNPRPKINGLKFRIAPPEEEKDLLKKFFQAATPGKDEQTP